MIDHINKERIKYQKMDKIVDKLINNKIIIYKMR